MMAAEYTKKELLQKNKSELAKLCKEYKVKSNGNKSEMAQRILTKIERKNKKGSKSKVDIRPRLIDTLPQQQCILYLTYGYFNKIYKSNKEYSTSLIEIIIEYLGNIFVNFDTIYNDYAGDIYENGMFYKRGHHIDVISGGSKRIERAKKFYIGCSKSFKKGVSIFKIELIDGDWSLCSIGIVSNVKDIES